MSQERNCSESRPWLNRMQQDEVSFGRFVLDLRHRKLTGEGAPIELKSKAFDILAVLASAQGEVVTKDELMAKVWPGACRGGKQHPGPHLGTPQGFGRNKRPAGPRLHC